MPGFDVFRPAPAEEFLHLAARTALIGGPRAGVGGVQDVARDGHMRDRPSEIVPGLAGYPGAGDVWSTVGDLARYALAVSSGALLSERSRRLVHHPHAAVPAGPAGPRAPEQVLRLDDYGYGYYLGTVAGNPAATPETTPGSSPSTRGWPTRTSASPC